MDNPIKVSPTPEQLEQYVAWKQAQYKTVLAERAAALEQQLQEVAKLILGE
jgi:hypothetical protein